MQNTTVLFRRLSFLLAGALLASNIGCSGTATLESSKDKSQANPLDADEQALLAALSAYRTTSGIAGITGCFTLNISASTHADDMRDNTYLDDIGLDGSTVRTRSCAAGYQDGCSMATAMGELVSSGLNDPNAIVAQWTGDPKTNAIVLNPHLVVAGVATSFGSAPPVWAVDLGGADEASCNP